MSPAREIAFRVLQRVHGGGYATDLLRREKGDQRDLGLAESITLGCLRHQSQLDYLIEFFSGRTQPKLDDAVGDASLVFQAQEHKTLGRPRTLAADHAAGHSH